MSKTQIPKIMPIKTIRTQRRGEDYAFMFEYPTPDWLIPDGQERKPIDLERAKDISRLLGEK